MKAVLKHILSARQQTHKMLAVLLDPERPIAFKPGELDQADIVLVGGSTGAIAPDFIGKIRSITSRPIVLFPGNGNQFTADADAILFLSVLSAQSADVLIGQQLAAAPAIMAANIESIPMGYILIDGGKPTSVAQASHSTPIPQDQIKYITDLAITGQLLGKQLIYLEAGSGALTPVSTDIIASVRKAISIPLIVGGGICTPEAMHAAFQAGADIVVIGNHFESHPDQLPLFCQCI